MNERERDYREKVPAQCGIIEKSKSNSGLNYEIVLDFRFYSLVSIVGDLK